MITFPLNQTRSIAKNYKCFSMLWIYKTLNFSVQTKIWQHLTGWMILLLQREKMGEIMLSIITHQIFYRTFYCIPQNPVFLLPCSFSFCLIACNIFPNTFKLSSPPRHFQGRDVESLITLLRILFQEMRRSLFINEKDQLTQ